MTISFPRSKAERKATEHPLKAILPAQVLLALCLTCSCVATAQGTARTGDVEGTVFVMNSGATSFLPGVKVELKGPETLETVSDKTGAYSVKRVKPGEYIIEASLLNMEAKQTVTVESGAAIKATLEMKPVVVNTTVTVTGASQDTESLSAAVTIPEKTIVDAPNASERFEALLPLVPGVVRGPDGRINMKGTRNTQSGALVNSANVTDPASGSPAINLPIDVVSSVRVISNPYDPQYGKLTGALSTVETKTGNYEKFHFTIQNVVPRLRDRDGTIAGIGAATPRMTLTGPLLKDRLALTQSFEYRFVRTPVNSLPPLKRDTKLEGFNSYTQLDLIRGAKQTATVSVTVYPQKLDYMGLNTFTPQPSTADFRQRGYQVYAQHRYITGPNSILISQFSYKTYDVDINAQNDDPYQLLIDTTTGGFFNRQSRRTSRYDLQESYQFAPHSFLGSHQIKVGMNYAHSALDGLETFFPVELIGSSGASIERITFTPPNSFSVGQNETAAYVSDQWSPSRRLLIGLGLRMDNDTVTSSTHFAPRLSVLATLTKDGKTLLKGGAGIFYDRVPLMFPIFDDLPARTVTMLGPSGEVLSSTAFDNRIVGSLENPRSTSWNVALERQVTKSFTARIGYEQRNTARDFVVSPIGSSPSGTIELSNRGADSYREFQVTGHYHLPRFTMNASYVHSRAFGNLNDPFLFIGNYPQPVIQPDAKARLLFDAPNRFLFSPDVAGPWKLTIAPVYDLHTGFPYSVENEYRDYIGARNMKRFPRFSSCDLQVTRPVSLHAGDRQLRMRIGASVFNLFNHFNPRDVQNDIDSSTFGNFYNDAWREYRGKLVFEF
jgi:TonB dependent receptor/CarboxypepD_reg-like domain